LYGNITLYDNSKTVIYTTPSNYFTNAGLGEPINVDNGSTFGHDPGPLPYPVQITGEHENDYIQFTYGSLSWTSKDKTGAANCSNGGWNPRNGPVCPNGGTGLEDTPAENQVDCCFPC